MARTLLWAVDALGSTPELLDSAVAALKPLSSKLGAAVQPVHVLTPAQFGGGTELSEIAEVIPAHSFRPAVDHVLRDQVSRVDLPSMLRPLVLTIERTSIPSAVAALSEYADRIDAEMILASSHGRHGLGRLFLGSFAETLMSYAHRPVMVLHPGIRTYQFDRMIFPTDLSEGSYRHFREALEVARKLGASVRILHCVSHSLGPILQSGVYLLSGGWMPIHSPWNGELEELKRQVDSWTEEATRAGVQASGAIYSQGGGIAETIIRVATEEHAGMIAMAAESGPIASTLLGSITREVARRAPCPLIALRSMPGTPEKKRDAA